MNKGRERERQRVRKKSISSQWKTDSIEIRILVYIHRNATIGLCFFVFFFSPSFALFFYLVLILNLAAVRFWIEIFFWTRNIYLVCLLFPFQYQILPLFLFLFLSLPLCFSINISICRYSICCWTVWLLHIIVVCTTKSKTTIKAHSILYFCQFSFGGSNHSRRDYLKKNWNEQKLNK